ncbi:MAG: hypothetical protein ACFFDN_02180 [Candidatus Hodarchaeota archaeon]
MSFKKNLRTDLDELPSITPRAKKLLMENGIVDVEKLAATDLKHLIAFLRDSDIAIKLTEEAEVIMDRSGFGFVMGDELLEELESVETMTTGCHTLDAILHNGLETNRFYAFYGPNGVGKTNLLYQLICMASKPKDQGGLNSPAIFLDAEGNFKPQNLKKIALRFKLNPDKVVKSVARLAIPYADQLIYALEKKLFPKMEETGARIVLLDSITTNVRAEYVGEGVLWARQGLLGKVAHALKNAAQAFNAVIVVANQVTTNPHTKEYTYSGGNVLGHEIQVRVSMFKHDKFSDEVWFTVEKAVDLKQDACILKLTGSGFYDTEILEKKEP